MHTEDAFMNYSQRPEQTFLRTANNSVQPNTSLKKKKKIRTVLNAKLVLRQSRDFFQARCLISPTH